MKGVWIHRDHLWFRGGAWIASTDRTVLNKVQASSPKAFSEVIGVRLVRKCS